MDLLSFYDPAVIDASRGTRLLVPLGQERIKFLGLSDGIQELVGEFGCAVHVHALAVEFCRADDDVARFI